MKTVVITGASRGIGHRTVIRFVREGWRVISCSRDDIPPDRKVTDSPHRHIPTDLADRKSIDAFVTEANDFIGSGPVHALVNNAGVSPKTSFRERLGTLNGGLDHWREVFELNFFAPLVLARGFAAALHRGEGAIVNVTSIVGHRVHPFAGSAYACSKAALSALTREMASEFAHLSVRVNAIAPGEIETAMLSPEYDDLVPRIPLGRMGTPEEVAGTIFYLCGPDSTYVSGTEIMITGGQHLI
ncbi:MAG: SDR family oxidoreductase [Rhodospirillales bacterium]|nr:SDR family oxidoreductase [Rhodospirillales bacterium]